MRRIRKLLFGTACAVMVFVAGVQSSEAQNLGTFRFQLQPTDEVVTLTIVKEGPVFVLSGWTDSQLLRFATFGTAFFRPDGLVGLNFTTQFEAQALHTNVTLNPTTLAATWTDDAGNSGAFVLVP